MFSQYNRYFEEMKKSVAMLDDTKAVHDYVEKYLPPKTFEKKAFGEVFTPLSLVRDMLDAVEKYGDKDFWTDPKNRILDPAAGIGNFPLIAYEKFMEGLKKAIPNAEKRKRHILENMLYMVELNKNNVRLMKRILGGGQYKLNIVQGDFLSEAVHDKMKREWSEKVKDLKFDLVMGNPPFQKPVEGTRKGGYGGTSLWDKFVLRTLKEDGFVRKDGLFAFINPSSWRKPESELRALYEKHDVLYLKINSKKDGQIIFGVSSRFDWYVLRNNKSKRILTVVHDEDHTEAKLYLDKWKFIPNGRFALFQKLFDFSQKNTFDVIYSSSAYETRKEWMSEHRSDKNKYPVVHTLNSEGKGLWYSQVNDKGHFGIPKVLLTFGEYQYPYNDYKGEYGMSQIIYGLPIKNKREGDEIVKAINSDTFKTILKYSKWNVFNTDWRMFNYLRDDFYSRI